MEKTYQIITDATADLNAELMQESGLEMLPMDVEIEGKRYSYAPVGGDLGEAEFYRALQAGKRASTSQINPLVYESCFERFLKAGMDVLYVCFTSGLSGTIMAAQTCMEELRERYPERKLICVDSLCASAGEGLLARRAAQDAAGGTQPRGDGGLAGGKPPPCMPLVHRGRSAASAPWRTDLRRHGHCGHGAPSKAHP